MLDPTRHRAPSSAPVQRLYRVGVPHDHDVPLHRSALLALWTGTPTSGGVAAVQGDDEPHEVIGLEDGDTLADLFAAWRRVPGEIVSFLPVPGDLAAPAEVAALAAEAEECALLRTAARTWVAIPEITSFGPDDDLGTAVTWTVQEVAQVRPLAGIVGTLAEAEQDLRDVLRRSVDELVDLDLARWRPEAAAALAGLRDGGGPEPLPPGLAPRRVRVLTDALRMRQVVALATVDDGASVTSWQADRRSEVLRTLDRAARHAVVAATLGAIG